MGSSTSTTKQFLEGLEPFQRRAVRKLELHLLASVTEAWSLRSILRSIAGVSDSTDHQKSVPDSWHGEFDISCSRSQSEEKAYGTSISGGSDLRELIIFISTRDLLLAQADSLVGLLHILTVPPAAHAYAKPCTPFACTASWVTEGLVYLRSLRRLRIVIEASVSVASQLTTHNKTGFSNFVKSVLPRAVVEVEWITQKNMILSPDDDEWVSFLGGSDLMASDAGQVSVNEDHEGRGMNRRVGWSSWGSIQQ
ncbi:hypothetical protein A1O7_01494 [Cladophialophora yegresii CBS 114405]|uniref:Uncharacterized protein n=1 Tax=Cladophialophora yegresii CBS 114405 TaxID=1182544 RepID=W9X3T4_9EURO|nr:uncharacterized protein A1O7_01494 [Cladophialophora yegresii CBS 114405]EXJ65154.1 hypothetical protein A1O7_01494 [Cladophialophora yegresii CBS 114405]